jgi:hypothetical protein
MYSQDAASVSQDAVTAMKSLAGGVALLMQ